MTPLDQLHIDSFKEGNRFEAKLAKRRHTDEPLSTSDNFIFCAMFVAFGFYRTSGYTSRHKKRGLLHYPHSEAVRIARFTQISQTPTPKRRHLLTYSSDKSNSQISHVSE